MLVLKMMMITTIHRLDDDHESTIIDRDRGGSRDFERGVHHQGTVRSLLLGGFGGMTPQKILKSRSSKMQFPSILGIKWWGNVGEYVSGPT